MRTLAALLSILAALVLMTPPAQAEVITYHPGGSGAMALEMSRRAIVVDGPCLSACAFSAAINPRVCFTKRAILGFHQFRDPGTGAPMPEATKWWLDQLPDRIRRRIEPLHHTKLTIIGGAELGSLFRDRRCP